VPAVRSVTSLARPLALVAIGSTLLLLSACGGGGASSDGVASLSGAAAASGATTTAAVDTQQAWLDFAQCMRDNGVDMKDPTFDANGNVQGGFGPDSGIDFRSEATRTAMDACRDKLPARGPGSGGGPTFDRSALQDAFNTFTACLRDNGVQVDDVTLPEPGSRPAGPNGSAPQGSAAPGGSDGSAPAGGFQGGPPPSGQAGAAGGQGFDPTTRLLERLGLDPQDPAVAKAVSACSSALDGAFPGRGATTTTGA
jgi:hypothetical protein